MLELHVVHWTNIEVMMLVRIVGNWQWKHLVAERLEYAALRLALWDGNSGRGDNLWSLKTLPYVLQHVECRFSLAIS